jgi:hypothetical protein
VKRDERKMQQKTRSFFTFLFIGLMLSSYFLIFDPNQFASFENEKKLMIKSLNNKVVAAEASENNYSIFSKIFPLVQKQVLYSEPYLHIRFDVVNTLSIPLHNFTLTYYRSKSTQNEIPAGGYVEFEKSYCQFSVDIDTMPETSQIVFNFTMTPSSVLKPGETVAFHTKIDGVFKNYTLGGDGVIWRSAETISLPVIYTIDDPEQNILEPSMECAKLDFDSDGLSNSKEWELGLNPFTQEFYVKWIQRSSYFELAAENISSPELLYLSHAILNIPPFYEGLYLTLTLQELGLYSILKNVTMNKRVIYPELSEIAFPFILASESGQYDLEFTLQNLDSTYDIIYNLSLQIDGQIPLDILVSYLTEILLDLIT